MGVCALLTNIAEEYRDIGMVLRDETARQVLVVVKLRSVVSQLLCDSLWQQGRQQLVGLAFLQNQHVMPHEIDAQPILNEIACDHQTQVRNQQIACRDREPTEVRQEYLARHDESDPQGPAHEGSPPDTQLKKHVDKEIIELRTNIHKTTGQAAVEPNRSASVHIALIAAAAAAAADHVWAVIRMLACD